MDHQSVRASPMIVGGLFLGFWLYLDFFTIPVFGNIDLVLWNFWGIMGLAVAGAIYASRIANTSARIVIWVLLGIALGFLTMVLVFNQVGEAIAALFTVAGAGLIVTGLPGGWNLAGEGQWQDANGQPR